MPKSNKGRNAFFFFMIDWAHEASIARGTTVTVAEASKDPKCSEDWKNLASQFKGHYVALAKESKVKAQGSAGKKTALGESLTEVEEMERKQAQFQQNMSQYIDSVVAMGMQHNNLAKIKFVFMHMNYFFEREIGINKYEFGPAEFAVGVFSLENGVQNIYHELLNVPIPLGYKRTAIETSRQTHQIPIGLEEGQSDYQLMYNNFIKIMEMEKTGNKYPPLFTTKDRISPVESLLIKMTQAANESIDDFQIYSLEELFAALRNAATSKNVNDQSIPLVVAEHVFSQDIFSAVLGIECEFHKIIDGGAAYCSKSAVTRWGFTICDYCCEYLNIEMIDGVHRPPKQPILNNEDINIVKERLDALKLYNQTCVNMNGVSPEHRIKVSERTYEEEQKRRREGKPIVIIDYSKRNDPQSSTASANVTFARPLRVPNTKPRALYDDPEEDTLFTEKDFPAIGGRGILSKGRNKSGQLPGLGRGRGGPLH